MRTVFIFCAVLPLLLLTACGGGSAVPGGQQTDDLQPAADQAQPVEAAPDSQPQAGSQPGMPQGSTNGALVRISQATIELPPLPPGVFDPSDTELPQLLLFPIHDGKVLHGQVHLSATAIDDSGVNFIALIVDDELLHTVESGTLQYVWDTEQHANGPHLVQFLVRDNGNNIGVCGIAIEVDNDRLWCRPQVAVTRLRSRFDGVEYERSFDIAEYRTAFSVAGQVELEISAQCEAGIARLEFYGLDGQATSWHEGELLAAAEGGTLTATVDSTLWDYESVRGLWRWTNEREFRAIAEDTEGNTTTLTFYLIPYQDVFLVVGLVDEFGELLEWEDIGLMPKEWQYEPGMDLAGLLETSAAPEDHRLFRDVLVGHQTLIIKYEGEYHVVPVVVNPETYKVYVQIDARTFQQVT